MKLSLTENSAAWSISSYSDGQFTLRGQHFSGSHFFYPLKKPQPWGITAVSELDTGVFTSELIEDIEMIIIGSGKTLVFPDDEQLMYFYQNNIGFEIMDTAAACRTWNILLSEDRNVMAALIPV
ncbi:MAG: hypothetical protein HKP55_08500 [Gammaproteobacteria bacterium]|nr:hypothetical protein [Gammaproteobacteria bacterium]